MEEKIFKRQKKQKLTPNKNHYTVLTYVEASKENLEKNKPE